MQEIVNRLARLSIEAEKSLATTLPLLDLTTRLPKGVRVASFRWRSVGNTSLETGTDMGIEDFWFLGMLPAQQIVVLWVRGDYFLWNYETGPRRRAGHGG